VTDDCQSAWAVLVDRHHLAFLDRSSASKSVLENELLATREISDVYPIAGTRSAWVIFTDAPELGIVDLTSNGLRLAENAAHLPNQFFMSDYAFTRGNRGLWIVGTGKGLYLAQRGQALDVPELRDVDLHKVFPSNDGDIVWADAVNNGAYAVDRDGHALNGGRPILADENVVNVWSGPSRITSAFTGPYAWIVTAEGKLFVMRGDSDGHGGFAVHALNGGQAIEESPGKAMAVEEIRPVAAGDVLWATPISRYRYDSLWDFVWRLRVRGDAVEVTRLNSALHGNSSIRQCYPDRIQPSKLFLRVKSFSLYEIDLSTGKSERIQSPDVGVDDVYSSAVPGRYWLWSPYGAFLMGRGDGLSSAIVMLGVTRLDAARGAAKRLSGIEASMAVPVVLSLPGGSPVNGEVRLTILPSSAHTESARAFTVAAFGTGTLTNGRGTIRLLAAKALDPGQSYDVELAYTDKVFTSLLFAWRDLEFRPAWYQTPFILALALIFVPTTVLLAVLRNASMARRWVPMVLPVIEAASVPEFKKLVSISIVDVGVAAVALFAVVLAIGAISPRAFRSVADLYPYRWIAPFALQMPFLRRILFKGYLDHMEELLIRARIGASGEVFVSLPAGVTDHVPLSPMRNRLTADEVADVLTAYDPGERAHVLIEAPGGRGKSAFLNELISVAIQRRKADPSKPLPVLLNSRAQTVLGGIATALGTNAITSDITALQVRQGDLIVFIDGLSESAMTIAEVETFFRGTDATRLCASSRTDGSTHDVFTAAGRAIVLEPCRLDADVAVKFVESYTKAENGPPVSDEELSSLLAAAAIGDGVYSPLILRFAMLLPVSSRRTLAEIYQATLERLLGGSHRAESEEDERKVDAIVAEAEALAFETYWQNRQRGFAHDRPDIESTSAVRRLLRAGVLIDADRGAQVLTKHPRSVKFLHDTLQSYLAAKYLSKHAEWDCFFRAAGEEQFAQSQSDIFDRKGAEMFYMCVLVFEPKERVSALMAADLLRWSRTAQAHLAITDIQDGLHKEVIDQLSATEMSAGDYLRRSVNTLNGDISGLAGLYAAVARKIWPHAASESKAA
jgi:hypothetical protein